MTDPPGEAVRPRPRPGPRVAGRRHKAAPSSSDPARSADGPEEKTAPAAAAQAAPRPKRPAPPRTAATRAAAVQAAAAKAAAARRSASKVAAAKATSTDAPPTEAAAKKATTSRPASSAATTTSVDKKSAAKPRATKAAAKPPAVKAAETTAAATKAAGTKAAGTKAAGTKAAEATSTETRTGLRIRRGRKANAVAPTARRSRERTGKPRFNVTVILLSVLTLLAAAAVTLLVIERVSTPARLDPTLLPAAKAAYSAMYSFDYTDPDGSVADSLSVLTGDLRTRFEADLRGQVVDSYLSVSATTRVDNITVGLQDINDQQTEAVVVAYGTFVVKSVNSGQQAAPQGSECAVTNDGADACVQTLQLNLQRVNGTWLVSNVTTLTES